MPVLELTGLELAGKRVLIRQDLNVPLKDGRVASDARLRASLPAIRHCVEAGARLMVMSHLGRPEEGKPEAQYSLQPVADYLADALGQPVPLVTDYLENAPKLGNGDVALLENVRFNPGEKADDETLSKRYAALCDIYVMDAFGTAHRAQASTHAPLRTVNDQPHHGSLAPVTAPVGYFCQETSISSPIDVKIVAADGPPAML